ncbi:MAG: GatB/YqeY domain-containing protein [Ruminococcaceae bacterium]|nr:GatB/YqeY domain-containing protein [Oscillospiraceae bacterium]
MDIKERLMEDLKLSMKEKDTVKKNAVQSTRAAILQYEKDNKVTLSDDEVIVVIAKEVKKRKDALPDYEKSGREDLIADLKREIEVLTAYLPSQLSKEELEEIVVECIKKVDAQSMKDMGKIMAEVMPKVQGRADGRAVNEIVKSYFA